MKNSVMRTLSYIKPYWYLIVLSTIGGIIKLSTPMILPQVLKHFTDDVLPVTSLMTTDEKLMDVYKWLLILCVIYFFILVPATYLRSSCSLKVANNVMHNMRCQLYDHLQRMSAGFHDLNKSGNIVSRFNSDVEQVYDFISNIVTNVWIDAGILIILIFLMCRVNVLLTVISVIALPLSAITTKNIRTIIRKNSRQAQREMAEMAGMVQEKMQGYAVVKLFRMEDYENKQFENRSKQIYKYKLKAGRMSSLGESFIGFFSDTITAIIVCMSAVIIIRSKMTIGDMIIFYSYLGYFTTPLRRFAELNVVYARTIAGIDRVYEMMDMPLDVQEKINAVAIPEKQQLNITYNNVFFRYDKDKKDYQLKDVSFSINEGEKVAFVGSSGCGKTTVVNLLARFYDVDQGSICIAGRDIRDYSLDSLNSTLGMVFQDTIIFSGTIEDNVKYGCQDATREQIELAAKAANAYDFILKAPDGWNTMLGEKGVGLSGGQKQRLAIARVFLKNPKILILDEATSALDSESEELVQEALDNLMKNRTSIVIAHRLSTIINSDRIIVMDRGKLVENGTHDDLLAHGGRYTQLYNMQFRDVLGNEEKEED